MNPRIMRQEKKTLTSEIQFRETRERELSDSSRDLENRINELKAKIDEVRTNINDCTAQKSAWMKFLNETRIKLGDFNENNKLRQPNEELGLLRFHDFFNKSINFIENLEKRCRENLKTLEGALENYRGRFKQVTTRQTRNTADLERAKERLQNITKRLPDPNLEIENSMEDISMKQNKFFG